MPVGAIASATHPVSHACKLGPSGVHFAKCVHEHVPHMSADDDTSGVVAHPRLVGADAELIEREEVS